MSPCAIRRRRRAPEEREQYQLFYTPESTYRVFVTDMDRAIDSPFGSPPQPADGRTKPADQWPGPCPSQHPGRYTPGCRRVDTARALGLLLLLIAQGDKAVRLTPTFGLIPEFALLVGVGLAGALSVSGSQFSRREVSKTRTERVEKKKKRIAEKVARDRKRPPPILRGRTSLGDVEIVNHLVFYSANEREARTN